MKRIDLKHIIETAGLKKSYIEAKLFPGNKHPNRAINNVINGVTFLNSEQIVTLSEILGVPIGFLFTSADWGMVSPAPKDRRVVQFRSYDYFAELDLDTMTTRVSKNGDLFFETITHTGGVEITQYLSSLTDLIIKYNKNECN